MSSMAITLAVIYIISSIGMNASTKKLKKLFGSSQRSAVAKAIKRNGATTAMGPIILPVIEDAKSSARSLLLNIDKRMHIIAILCAVNANPGNGIPKYWGNANTAKR